MMNKSENEELGDLIIEITKGNTDAIEEIYLRYGRAMEAIAKLYLQNLADVEDVVQDCLITIVTKAGKFRENKNAKAWIGTIVRNAAKNKARFYKSRREHGLELAHGLSTQYDEDALIVDEVFRSLTPAEQELAVYRYFQKCSVAEIAGILHRSKSTVQYRLDKLEEKLKNFYKKE